MASQFLRQTPEQIRAEAQNQLGQQAKAIQPGWGMAFFNIVLGCLGLLIPYIGIIIFLGCVGAAIWTIAQSQSAPRVDPQLLTGLSHNLRNMTKGPCPLCKTIIWITPEPGQAMSFSCPTCTANLHYDGKGTVSPT